VPLLQSPNGRVFLQPVKLLVTQAVFGATEAVPLLQSPIGRVFLQPVKALVTQALFGTRHTYWVGHPGLKAPLMRCVRVQEPEGSCSLLENPGCPNARHLGHPRTAFGDQAIEQKLRKSKIHA
jgi:hypothetical protein